MDGFAVEDFFIERRDSAGNLYLERTPAFPAPPPANLHFRIAADKLIERRSENQFAVGKSLIIHLPAAGIVRPSSEAQELLLPVTGGGMKLEYHPITKP